VSKLTTKVLAYIREGRTRRWGGNVTQRVECYPDTGGTREKKGRRSIDLLVILPHQVDDEMTLLQQVKENKEKGKE